MSFHLVGTDWQQTFRRALKALHRELRVVCPFIKDFGANQLLRKRVPEKMQIITRFNLSDFHAGVSDISALRRLRDCGAQIRGVSGLHAKVYLFGSERVIITSANLTRCGLTTNHEFGVVTDDSEAIASAGQFFDDLWQQAGKNVTVAQLDKWEKIVRREQRRGSLSSCPALSDCGAIVASATAAPAPFTPPQSPPLPPAVAEAEQWFVKFFGEGNKRAERKMTVLEEVDGSGSHWACNYPKGKRPRQVKDGAVIFLARLVKEPNDIKIYGRAIGLEHREGLDDATGKDIKRRKWKENWPHYIRVHHPEFLSGNLECCISLSEIMDELEADTFAPTARNAQKGSGNINPRASLRQKAHMELTEKAAVRINQRLQQAFERHGKLSPGELAQLDWPE